MTCRLALILGVAVSPSLLGQFFVGPKVQPATLTFWEPPPLYVYDCAINNRGAVVGTLINEQFRSRGFRVLEDRLEHIQIPGYEFTWITGINDRGDIAGYVDNPGPNTPEVGFVMRDGVTTFLPPVPAPDGGTLWPSGYTTGDINNQGTIVGQIRFVVNNRLITFGWIYSGGSYTLVRNGNDEATGLLGLNDRGEAVGYRSDGFATYRPLLYRQGQFEEVPLPPNGLFVGDNFGAVSINDRGDILLVQPRMVLGGYRSFLYRDGKHIEMTPVGSVENFARSINDRGDVCGVWATAGTAGTSIERSIGFVRPTR